MITKIITILILLLSVSIATLHTATMKEHEYALVDSLLANAGLEPSSLNFMKDWSLSTEYKISKIIDIINNPMKFPRFVDSLKVEIDKGDIPSLAEFLSASLFTFDDYWVTDHRVEGESRRLFAEEYDRLVNEPEDLFDYVEFLFQITDKYRNRAFGELSGSDKEILTDLSYRMWSDTGDKERYGDLRAELLREDFEDLNLAEIKSILDKIDWALFLTANRVFNRGVEVLRENLQQLVFTNIEPLVRETRWGKFIIGTTGNDLYHERFAFMLEPDGDDIYHSDLYTDFEQPYYLVIDLAGDDIWRNNTIGRLNRVLGGIGWFIDKSGNDQYLGEDLAFSSFLGFQYHYDGGGDDIYRLGRYSLGAATFGISLTLNGGGNDIYYSTGYSHGFGGTLGAGLLIDLSGDDLYYAGGKYTHAPLRPDDYRSMAQGFGFGVRPDWGGGIGILYDAEGNDTYEGGVYAQGVGYWYALGILYNGGGNDTFNAVQYAQGSGIHLAGGFLFNKAGDNSYYSRYGPGQGAGHDYAVGFLIDREGDDHYSIDGGNGLGLTNSVGIFLDVAGDDRYERNKPTNYGYANEARDSGGIGIFMDLGGNNIYPKPFWQNNNFWISGTYGIGIDTEQIVEEELAEEPEVEEKDLSEIDALTSVEELFRIAAEWEVGSAVERVRRARERILDFEDEAADFIFENKLDTKSSLEYRAILDFAQRSELFKEYVGRGLATEDSLAVKNAISLVGDLEMDEHLEELAEFLRDGKYLPATLGTLGDFSDDRVVALIIPYIDSPSEHLRFISARSLKRIDTLLSRRYLLEMVDDPSFLVRTTVKLAFPSVAD